MRIADFSFQPCPAGERRPIAEAAQGSEKLILNLGAGCREVHQASARVTVQGPQRCNRKDRRSLSGEIGASGSCRITGLVVEEDLTLPIVGLNAENRISEEQDGNLPIRTDH